MRDTTILEAAVNALVLYTISTLLLYFLYGFTETVPVDSALKKYSRCHSLLVVLHVRRRQPK
jgi:hypothetical protein